MSAAIPDLDNRAVTQRRAAEICGCSKDTIIRARLAGRFPGARLDRHTWTVPLSDLVAAGLADPTTATTASRESEPAAVAGGAELVRAEARVAALEDLVARQDDELRFLRQLATDTLARRDGR